MPPDAKSVLADERSRFRQSLPPEVGSRWDACGRRIAVVLSGGGARGAYEAGVLLAFQDARLPTHILAATSIGSINAASYAAHSPTLVGNAESLVESWSVVTPSAVGIDWSRYIFVLGGLVAATAGLGNLLIQATHDSGLYVHLAHPRLTWIMLAVAGIAVLLLYDQMPYIGYVAANLMRHRGWKPDRRKAVLSVLANLLVWSFVVIGFASVHLHLLGLIFLLSPRSKLLAMALVVTLLALGALLRQPASFASHRFLRLPLRSGLFPNYERTRFLRERIHPDGVRASPIRLVMTSTEVETGAETYFSNALRDALLADPGVDPSFVEQEIVPAPDIMQAVIASSAFPIAYEVVPMMKRLWTDGGIVANQPIRPALRLGADTLFLVMVSPREQRGVEVRTFLDVGVRAIDILMSQNLRTDIKNLDAINLVCQKYAGELGVRPEQIVVDMGTRAYRYVKNITVQPAEPLAATILDFDGRITGPAIAQGYRDGARAVLEFLEYVSRAPATAARFVLRFKPERM